MADIANYRAKKFVAKKIKDAQRAAKDAGQPFSLADAQLTDDERTLMGLPRLQASPMDVAGVATQFAGEYPEAPVSDIHDFAAALMGTLPPVPFNTTATTGGLPSVTQIGPPAQKQLGRSRAELAQEREFEFRKSQTTEESARAKEAGVASLSAQVSSITGLGPEEAKTVASYYFGEPTKGPLPRNLRALADFSKTHADLAATKALYLERLAAMQAAGTETQVNYLKLLHELQKNPQMDQAISLLKDMKGSSAEQLKAALATQLFQAAGLTEKEVAADPTGLAGIIEFIFGSFRTKIAPGDVTVPGAQAPGAPGAPGAGQGLPTFQPTQPITPDLAPFGLPKEIAEQLGVQPGTEQLTIPGRTPPVAGAAAPGPTSTGKRSETAASMQGFADRARAIVAGQPVPRRDGSTTTMTMTDLAEDYIAQYDMQGERATELRKQASDADARNASKNKKAEGVSKQEAVRDSILEQLLSGASTAKDVITTSQKLGDVASEHGGAIMKAAAKRIPEIMKQRAKEAVAKELADAVLTFLKARKKIKERRASAGSSSESNR